MTRSVVTSGLVALAIGWSPAGADEFRLLSASDHQTYRAVFETTIAPRPDGHVLVGQVGQGSRVDMPGLPPCAMVG